MFFIWISNCGKPFGRNFSINSSLCFQSKSSGLRFFRGLKCKLWSLNIQAGSRHIYENDFKKLDTIFNSNYHDESEISFNSLIEKYKDSPKKFISNLREAADYTPVSKDKGRLQKIDFIKHG